MLLRLVWLTQLRLHLPLCDVDAGDAGSCDVDVRDAGLTWLVPVRRRCSALLWVSYVRPP